ncbi:MAG TPA: AgmX/PglI C-terminal domain-containing protein, partial [Polyangia bacterium]|nr:AgmX/PglI C-terminal domain-containing protein [Polyangia bacterium]
ETADGGTVWIGRALAGPSLGATAAPAAAADPGDLLALWDRARLSWFERPSPARPSAADATRVALAPLRALLVLESDADYARYDLEAPEIAGAPEAPVGLEEGKMGLRRTKPPRAGLFGLRGPADEPDPALARALAEEQARSAGILDALGGRTTAAGHDGLGIVATGASLLGSRYGVGTPTGGGYAERRRPRTGEVILEPLIVRGPLDEEVLRRIVRRRLGELQRCYDDNPSAGGAESGRMVFELVIAAGKAVSATWRGSNVGGPGLAPCFAAALRRWPFPTPSGGLRAAVTVAFTFRPTGARLPAPQPAAPAPPPAAAPPPLSAGEAALALFAKEAPLPDRVAEVCRRLGLDRTTDPETAAWSIDRTGADLPTMTLVARLLAAAGRLPDAVRVLSEHAPFAPRPIAAELRRLGAARDAQEIETLERRTY